MNELLPAFRSALSTVGSAINQGIVGVTRSATPGGAATANQDHALVGTTVEVGTQRVKIYSLLAEGGFALVFSCRTQDGKWLALKRQIATDADSANAIIKEISFAKNLSGHPAIVRYITAAQHKSQGRAEFSLLTELCSGGPLIDVMQRQRLAPDHVIKIFHALCSAVHHMHDRNPPITHRDLKIENLLFDSRGYIKLCDFGSATTEIFRPDDSWSVSKRSLLEEDMQKFTTPMYRAPEILDTYSNYPIGPSQDIWALGCILVYLCYGRHPFEDSAKLAIVNANYKLPKEETHFTTFHPIVDSLLQPDPYQRAMIIELLERLEIVAVAFDVDLRSPITGLGLPFETADAVTAPPPRSTRPSQSSAPVTTATPATQPHAAQQVVSPPPRPPPPQQQRSRADEFPLDEEERIRAHNERSNREAAEEQRRVLEEEETLRRQLVEQQRETKVVGSSQKSREEEDPFSIFDTRPQPSTSSTNMPADSLLGDWPIDAAMQRNASAPSLDGHPKSLFDPFADFMAASPSSTAADAAPTPPPRHSSATSSPAGRSTSASRPDRPSHRPATGADRVDFESFFAGDKPPAASRAAESAFDELLNEQGFSSSAKNAQRSLADLKRDERIKTLDPVTIKIQDWTRDKERNLRALLSSLDMVLWDEVQYTPPNVTELLSATNVKKQYYKAIRIIHPDKQTGQPHEQLARAIFTELSEAWSLFEKA